MVTQWGSQMRIQESKDPPVHSNLLLWSQVWERQTAKTFARNYPNKAWWAYCKFDCDYKNKCYDDYLRQLLPVTGGVKVKLHLVRVESIFLQLVKLKHYVYNFKVITLSSYYSTTKYLKGQMNQKIDIFSFVALPSPNTKKNHPKWDLG